MSPWPSETDKPGCTDAGGGGCDLKEFDDLHCKVNGIAEQATYLKNVEGKLAERRKKFDTSRAAYQQMYDAVQPQIKVLQTDLADPDGKLCAVPKADRTCLSEAWDKIKDELDA